MRSRLLLVLGLGLATIAGCCTPSATRSLSLGRPLAPAAPCPSGSTTQPPLAAVRPAAPLPTGVSPITPATALAPPVMGLTSVGSGAAGRTAARGGCVVEQLGQGPA